jgi:hypothetical protein
MPSAGLVGDLRPSDVFWAVGHWKLRTIGRDNLMGRGGSLIVNLESFDQWNFVLT